MGKMLDINFRYVEHLKTTKVVAHDVKVPELKQSGKTYFIPELRLNVFIKTGHTLQNWLITQREQGLISKNLWGKLKLKYF